MRIKTVLTFSAALGVACSGHELSAQTSDIATSAVAQDKTPQAQILKRDFERMMRLFPGRYDNQEQVYFNENLDIAEDLRHERIHHIFTPVDLDAFSGRLFYVEQYQNDDPKNVYRQRLYEFKPDFTENAIRLTIHIPKDAKAILGAHEDVSKLDGLSPSDFTTYAGCDVFWTAELDHFRGVTKTGACRVKSERSGKTLIIDDDLQLSDTGLWVRDSAVDEDGNYVYGHKGNIHHKNLRARMFSCWVSPQKADGGYGFYNNLTLHDQGGRIWVDGEDHERMGLKMRNVVWPTGRNRNSLVLYAYRGDDEETAISYAWTSPDADRIAINLRWIQASCTLDNN